MCTNYAHLYLIFITTVTPTVYVGPKYAENTGPPQTYTFILGPVYNGSGDFIHNITLGSNNMVKYGSNISIECVAFGAPNPTTTIVLPDNTTAERSYLDSVYSHTVSDDVVNINKFAIVSRVLNLNNVRENDSGNYSCVASNGVAESGFATFELIVQGNILLSLT